MSPTIAMAAMIDYKGPRRDIDLVRTKIVDELGALQRPEPVRMGKADIHAADPRCSTMEHHQLRARGFGKCHGMAKNRAAIRTGQRGLSDNDDRALAILQEI